MPRASESYGGGRQTVPGWSDRSVIQRMALAILVGVCIAGCKREGASGTAAPPKPVSVATLSTGIPRTETLVAGVVEPFRRSDVSFDVSGLVA
ncbi:MAG: hypothetical protein AAF937_09870, partial [Planctomycetota bacterium]